MSSPELEKRLKSIEERLQIAEDKEDIKELQYRYKNAFMMGQFDEVIKYFADDGVISIVPDGSAVGRGIDEIKRQFGKMASVHVGAETDMIYHPIITVSGDNAKATWMVNDSMHVKNKPLFTNYGIYTAEYKRVNGEWKISYLQHRIRTIKPVDELKPPDIT
jgi:ketosteroid isomerase-like protein